MKLNFVRFKVTDYSNQIIDAGAGTESSKDSSYEIQLKGA